METTIQIEATTRQKLKAAKRGGETYDEVINRILDLAESAPLDLAEKKGREK